MYRVVKRFEDLQDGRRVYEVGSVYPRPGMEVTKERLEELSSNRNRRGVAVIAEDSPEEASPVAEERVEDVDAGVSPPKTAKAKGRPRKGQGKNA